MVKVDVDAFQRVILVIFTSDWIVVVPAIGGYMNWKGSKNSKHVCL